MRNKGARWLAWCSLTWLLAILLVLDALGDRTWWSVAFLFGPRWVFALPWLGLVPWLAKDVRRAVVPATAGLAIAVFPVLGVHLGLHRARAASGVPFRVLELNAEGGTRQGMAIVTELRAEHPDLVVVAECGVWLTGALQAMTEYHVRNGDKLCLLSRGDVLEWQARDQADVWRQGGSGGIVRAVVSTPAGPLRVGLVHLATPRTALDEYFDLSELWKQGPNTRANMMQRDHESMLARQWILTGAGQPTVVAGDFNLPVESAIYRRHWGDLDNAFGRGGYGTGYTKHTRLWGVRIDHVLTTSDIGVRNAFIGRNVGSDHVPLITDLVLPSPVAAVRH